MRKIELETIINAPVERCFDLARSIDFHAHTMKDTNERAVGGTITGLIGKNEMVSWEANHFGIKQRLTSLISELEYGKSFTDEMTEGPFKSIWHKHSFRSESGKTIMHDSFVYEVPFGIFGKVFDRLVLKNYLIKLLTDRNLKLKNAAESEEWKAFLMGTTNNL